MIVQQQLMAPKEAEVKTGTVYQVNTEIALEVCQMLVNVTIFLDPSY